MATIAQENFEGGTHGEAITTANSGFSLVTGTDPTYDSDSIEGAVAGRYNTDSSNSICRLDFPTQPSAWFSWYIKFDQLPTSNVHIVGFMGSSGKIGDLRVTPAGELTVRNLHTAIFTSTATLTQGEWARLAMRIDPGQPGGLQLRVYTGSNLHGTTPDDDQAADSTVSETDFSHLLLGVTTAGTQNAVWDRIIVDNSDEPAPLDVGPESNTYVRVDGVWQPAWPYVHDGQGWVPASASPVA